jgi:LuxR family maltose regulon positive regulatory protein
MTKKPRFGSDRAMSHPFAIADSVEKVDEPIAPEQLIPRGQVIDLLRESEAPLVLVTAPPGYGKTSLVRQWSDEDPRRFAWLSLDASDNDPVMLVLYLVLALQRIEEVDAGILGVVSGRDRRLAKVMLPRLGRMLWRRRRPFVLVLDDADTIVAPDALDVLVVIAEHIPEGSQLVVIGRRAPDFPWSRFRAGRRLFELGSDDLRLTSAEASALLESDGLRLTGGEATALLERTEGWAAGLHLAAASHTFSACAYPDRVDAEAPLVSTYLRDELWARLPTEQQSLLLRCSILDRLYAPLCNEVAEVTHAEETLRQLAAQNCFLSPIEGSGGWYRLHAMFREMLRTELHRRHPHLQRALHGRASHWLERHDDPVAATDHAIAAGDNDRTARLIWQQVALHLSLGNIAAIEKWLSNFTEQELRAHAKLALAAAWCAVARGLPVNDWLAAAEDARYDADGLGETDSIVSATALLRAAAARHGVVQMGADARFSARLQAPGDPWWGFTQYLEAVAAHLTGHHGEARLRLEQLAHLAMTIGAQGPQALALCQLAVLAIERDDWEAATSAAEQAIVLVRQVGLDRVPFLPAAFAVTPFVLAKAGRVDEARAQARVSTAAVALMIQLPPWSAAQARYLLARAHMFLGDTAAARVLLSEGQNLLADVPDASQLHRRLDTAWRQIETFPLGLPCGVSTLTTAELRILQLLPTHLSFEQIGRRLFVSRNTVKTEAIAAYRKLGASSRSEAVDRAQALGMI